MSSDSGFQVKRIRAFTVFTNASLVRAFHIIPVKFLVLVPDFISSVLEERNHGWNVSDSIIVMSHSDVISIKLLEEEVTELSISNSGLAISIEGNRDFRFKLKLNVKSSESGKGSTKRVA